MEIGKKKKPKQKTNPNNIHVTLSRCDGLGPFQVFQCSTRIVPRFSNIYLDYSVDHSF